MDRNSLIGLALIASIFLVFSQYMFPTPPETPKTEVIKNPLTAKDSLKNNPKDTTALAQNDSAAISQEMTNAFGVFAPFAQGKEETTTLENDFLRLTLTNKGAKIQLAELKNYKTHEQKPLLLFNKDDLTFNYTYAAQNRTIKTDELYFKPIISQNATSDSVSIVYRIEFAQNQYIEHVYSLKKGDYMVRHQVNYSGVDKIIDTKTKPVLNWQITTPRQEQSIAEERQYSTVHYQYTDESESDLGINTAAKTLEDGNIKWISLKQKFFNIALIANDPQGFANVSVSAADFQDETNVKILGTQLALPLENANSQSIKMQFYMGPNQYKILKSYDLGLDKILPLGWGIFGWINKYLILPIFNLLDSFHWSYGIIILVLTLVIKTLLYPLQYRSYLSTAKMRVLKPELEEIKARYEKDPARMQSENLKLYQKAGVNPLGGCIPLLFQIPVLIAMFNFFPSCIELRQEPFLWATDLSSYDSIFDLPFKIPFYGDHVSLFTILMTATTLLLTYMNNQVQMTSSNDPNAQIIKSMGYIMPVIFMFVLNSYSSGLTYYYFLANIVTIGQQYLIRKTVDENKLHLKIQENKRKNEETPKKKGGFQRRLEDMMKQQQEQKKSK